jgi:hypothetical protein
MSNTTDTVLLSDIKKLLDTYFRLIVASLSGTLSVDICPVGCTVPVAIQTSAKFQELIDAVNDINIDTEAININVDQVEALITATNLILNTLDRNYGTVGANTLRTASQIGNATGQADFNNGTATAQTLRVALTTDVQTLTSINVTISGSVASGATSISFKTDSAFTGSINGLTRTASTYYNFEAAVGKTLLAIGYTISAGSIDLDVLV